MVKQDGSHSHLKTGQNCPLFKWSTKLDGLYVKRVVKMFFFYIKLSRLLENHLISVQVFEWLKPFKNGI
jgi:hypothetical protein